MPLPWAKHAYHLRFKRQAVAVRAALGLADADHAAGVLVRFWAWAEDEAGPGGRLPGVTPAHLDEVMQRPGFAAAMVAVGWLKEAAGGLRIPKFGAYMGGAAAKPDATAAERRRRRRERLRDGRAGAGRDGRGVTGRDAGVTGRDGHGVTGRDAGVTVTPKMEREIEIETEDGSHPLTPAGGPADGSADRTDGGPETDPRGRVGAGPAAGEEPGEPAGGPDRPPSAAGPAGDLARDPVPVPAAARTTPGGSGPAARPARPTRGAPEADPRFQAFWAAYPRREKRRKAAQAFARLDPDDALLARMLAAVAARAGSAEWAKDGGRFVPHPTSWLNQRRWEDEPPPAAAPARLADGPHQRAVDEFLRAWKDRYDDAYPWQAALADNNAALAAVLAAVGGDVAAFAAVARRFLADGDPFLAKTRHGVGVMHKQLQRWLGGPPPAGPRPPRRRPTWRTSSGSGSRPLREA